MILVPGKYLYHATCCECAVLRAIKHGRNPPDYPTLIPSAQMTRNPQGYITVFRLGIQASACASKESIHQQGNIPSRGMP